MSCVSFVVVFFLVGGLIFQWYCSMPPSYTCIYATVGYVGTPTSHWGVQALLAAWKTASRLLGHGMAWHHLVIARVSWLDLTLASLIHASHYRNVQILLQSQRGVTEFFVCDLFFFCFDPPESQSWHEIEIELIEYLGC